MMYTMCQLPCAPQTCVTCHCSLKFRKELCSPCCVALAETSAVTDVWLSSGEEGLQAPKHASCSLVSLCACEPTDATVGTTQHASDTTATRPCYTNAQTMHPVCSLASTVCQLLTVTGQNPCAEAGGLPKPADLPAQDVVGRFCVINA